MYRGDLHGLQWITALPWSSSSSTSSFSGLGFPCHVSHSFLFYPPLPVQCFLSFLKSVSLEVPPAWLMGPALPWGGVAGVGWSWLEPALFSMRQPQPLLTEAVTTGLCCQHPGTYTQQKDLPLENVNTYLFQHFSQFYFLNIFLIYSFSTFSSSSFGLKTKWWRTHGTQRKGECRKLRKWKP